MSKFKPRMKIVEGGCYYHVTNRLSGLATDKPVDDKDKTFGLELLQSMSNFYFIEVISAVWMCNHFHLILYVPGSENLPSTKDIAKRHSKYYATMKKVFKYSEKQLPTINSRNKKLCNEVGIKMHDLSSFMRYFQQRFTTFFNLNHNRVGKSFSNYKSIILDGKSALEACLLYIELNPVRSGIVDNPGDYEFTTWGNYCATGHHIFHDNFVKHLKQCVSIKGADEWSDEQAFEYFGHEMTRIIQFETNATEDELLKDDKGRNKSMPVQYLKRTRHFTDGAIIGSRKFIQATASHFYDPKRVEKKQMAQGIGPSGKTMFSFRKLGLKPKKQVES
jgi:REP-associated tyrosine transposase